MCVHVSSTFFCCCADVCLGPAGPHNSTSVPLKSVPATTPPCQTGPAPDGGAAVPDHAARRLAVSQPLPVLCAVRRALQQHVAGAPATPPAPGTMAQTLCVVVADHTRGIANSGVGVLMEARLCPQ